MKQGTKNQADWSRIERLEYLNRQMKGCHRCELDATRQHVLAGEGYPDARLMLVALSPGEKEDLEGRMFIGPSGRVLDRLLGAAGIPRQSIYMTNLIKCMLPENRKPKMVEIEACSEILDEEISIVCPDIIVPLGYYANRTILKKYKKNAPEARDGYIRLYGHLIYTNQQKIYPLPHPASLLYNPSHEPEALKKYKKLHVLTHVCTWFPVCPMKRFTEAGCLEQKWIELYCKGDWESCIRYQMESQGIPHPDWMLPDGSYNQALKSFRYM